MRPERTEPTSRSQGTSGSFRWADRKQRSRTAVTASLTRHSPRARAQHSCAAASQNALANSSEGQRRPGSGERGCSLCFCPTHNAQQKMGRATTPAKADFIEEGDTGLTTYPTETERGSSAAGNIVAEAGHLTLLKSSFLRLALGAVGSKTRRSKIEVLASLIYIERKTVFFGLLHLIATLVTFQHFAALKFSQQQAATPKNVHFERWKKNVPTLEFGAMHAILLQMALLPVSMSRHILSVLSQTPLRMLFPFERIIGMHIQIGYTMVLMCARHLYHLLSSADTDALVPITFLASYKRPTVCILRH